MLRSVWDDKTLRDVLPWDAVDSLLREADPSPLPPRRVPFACEHKARAGLAGAFPSSPRPSPPSSPRPGTSTKSTSRAARGAKAADPTRTETFLFVTGRLEEHINQQVPHPRLLLTDRAYYVLDSESPHALTSCRRHEYFEVHHVRVSESNPHLLTIYRVRQQLLAVAKSGSDITWSHLEARTFRFERTEECFQVEWAMEAFMRDNWQRLLEHELLPDDETLQYTASVLKINRRGTPQDRVLVLTDKWLYNIEAQRGERTVMRRKKDFKWAVPLDCIKVVELTRRRDDQYIGPAISLYLDEKAAKQALKSSGMHVGKKGKKVNDYHTFCFTSEGLRSEFLSELARLFFMLKNNVDDPAFDQQTAVRLAINDREDGMRVRRATIASVSEGAAPGGSSSDIAERVFHGDLHKFTRGGSGSHSKYFELYSSGLLKWRDSEGKGSVVEGYVVAVSTDTEELKKKNLTEEERGLVLSIQTTKKTVHCLCGSPDNRDRWVAAIEAVLRKDKKA